MNSGQQSVNIINLTSMCITPIQLSVHHLHTHSSIHPTNHLDCCISYIHSLSITSLPSIHSTIHLSKHPVILIYNPPFTYPSIYPFSHSSNQSPTSIYIYAQIHLLLYHLNNFLHCRY